MQNQVVISVRYRALVGLIAGLISGIVFSLLVNPSPGLGSNLAISTGLGVIFGLFFGPKIHTAGAGLVWGEALGVLWWLTGSLSLIPLISGRGLDWSVVTLRDSFPILLGHVAGNGAVLGLSYYLLMWGLTKVIPITDDQSTNSLTPRLPMAQAIVPPLVQALIIGGLGGVIGSWVFVRGIEIAEFFPLVAGLMGSNAMMVGRILHYLIGTIIGLSFGLLFYRDVHGPGSGLVWGMSYGLLWWIIGPLTLLPWLLGFSSQPDWSLAAAQAVFPSLIAHLIYGAMVGLFYALANKFWYILFVHSDPLNRSREGAGVQGLRSILMGQVGGIIGGLLFTIVMVGVGALPRVASLIGARSAITGFIVHLIIAIIIGSSYGLLFRREAYSYGSGLAWGIVYGLLWWLVGALTLFPLLLRQPVDWSPATVVALYPSLVGHLLYGVGLGLFYQVLARHYDDTLSGRVQPGRQGTRLAAPAHLLPRQRTAGTPAPALWAVTLVLGVILPILLA